MKPIFPPACVEVDSNRRYVSVNDTACELLGYSREELLQMRIDDVSAPSGAHVVPMFERYRATGEMGGIFALRRKSGEVIRIRFRATTRYGRNVAEWTHWEP
jgi:PAS domain S-box-containing protein